MSRRTKDGEFLTDLVSRGLLVVSPHTELKIDPLESSYELTEVGRHAAEYGEYEWDPKTDRAIEPK